MFFNNPYTLLLAIPLLVIWWLYLFPDARNRWLRLLILALLLLALADPQGTGTTVERHLTLLLDNSLSVRGEALQRGAELAQHLSKNVPEQHLYLLTFGQQANVINRPGEPLEGLTGHTAEDASNLSAGLRLASALTPATGSHALLVISDGLYTGLEPRAEIPTLQQQHMRVHYVPIAISQQQDVAITRVLNPTRSAVGQPFNLAVEIHAPTAQTAELQLRNNRQQILAKTNVELQAGINRYSFNWQSQQTGLQQYFVELVVTDDAQPENNRASTALDIIGAPQVLVINRSGQSTALVRALQSSGIEVVLHSPQQTLDAARLKHYVAVVLENMPLDQLSDDADVDLAQYVKQLGGGLLITGGRSSYAMGGYYRSHLEDLLPVSMDRQEELRRAKLAMAIVLDRSGSMSASAAGGATKMDLANRGAVEAVHLLTPQDEVVVFAVDSQAHRVVPLQALGEGVDRRQLINKMLSIESQGGGIFVYEGLTAAIEALLNSDAPTRHIVLFSDAADSEEPGAYKALLQQWRGAGGSLSVIGLGTLQDPDAQLLEELAMLGGGRAYFTDNALQLPRVFTQDVMHVARESFIEQATGMQSEQGLLSLDFLMLQWPIVDGYNLSYLKPEAQLMLSAQDENQAPLVAGWQRGQGKVLAVLFEADGQFSGGWHNWSEYKPFFRQALEWLKRPQQAQQWLADMQISGSTATISLEVDKPQALTAAPQALVMTPDARKVLNIPLSWTTPNQLTGQFELSSSGIYHGAIQLSGQQSLLLPPRVLPYSPEFKPRHTTGNETGHTVLQQLAAATGGGLLTHIEQLTTATEIQRARGYSYAPLVLILALLLMVLDVGQRRGLWDKGLQRIWTGISYFKMPLPRWQSKPTRHAKPTQPTVSTEPVEQASTNDAFKRAKRRARGNLQ